MRPQAHHLLGDVGLVRPDRHLGQDALLVDDDAVAQRGETLA
jgi:hypothetical protein